MVAPASKVDMAEAAISPPLQGADGTKTSAKPAGKGRVIGLGIVAIVATSGLAYYIHSLGYEETDDAQIDGNIAAISPRVTGNVKTVSVVENQMVKAGDVLVELDTADLEVALAQAKAQVAQANAQLQAEDPSVPIIEASNKASVSSSGQDFAGAAAELSAQKLQIAQLNAQLAQAQANDRIAQIEKTRSEQLVKSGSLPQSDLDTKSATAAATAANVEAIKQSIAAAQERVTGAQSKVASAQTHLEEVRANAPRQVETRRANVVLRQAALDVAKAQLAQAELNLSYTKVIAPGSGIVGKKTVNVGDHIVPGQELMAISQLDSLWVTANFRETQLQKMHVGQNVKVHVDAIDTDFNGTVESIGGATGSRFSVLPPENATGNYVKVVQRIPVRVKIDSNQAGFDRLRPGMSVEPKVTLK